VAQCEAHKVPPILFEKAQRKEDVMRQYLVRLKGVEGLLFIGMAQQKSRVFRTEVRPIRDRAALWLDRLI
jgi:hypothetical protein